MSRRFLELEPSQRRPALSRRDSERTKQAGWVFCLSENGVRLVVDVPAELLTLPAGDAGGRGRARIPPVEGPHAIAAIKLNELPVASEVTIPQNHSAPCGCKIPPHVPTHWPQPTDIPSAMSLLWAHASMAGSQCPSGLSPTKRQVCIVNACE